MDIQKFVKSEVIMKHTKMTALLCTLALSGCISATAAPQAGSTPLDPYRAAVQKMKDLEKAEKKGEQSAPAPAPAPALSPTTPSSVLKNRLPSFPPAYQRINPCS